MMNKTILTIAMSSALFFTACNEAQKHENQEVTTSTEKVDEHDAEGIIKTTAKDKEGKTIDLAFDNNKGTATVNLNGETIELKQERAASGIWYKNDIYELRGKGNDVQLTKEGKVIFDHVDDQQSIVAKSANGDVLNMTFNNTEGTVKAYLNGGDQIDLKEGKPASGIWYKNDQYELTGKGNSYKLTKNSKTVFEN